MNSKILEDFIVKIESPTTSGSGIIYFPPTHHDLVFIFTAWHCVENTPLSELRITLLNQMYQCLEDGRHKVLSFEEKEEESDLAVLVLPRSTFPLATPEYYPFEFLNDFFDLKQGWTAGFPHVANGLKILYGEFRQMKNGIPNCFDVRTPKEDLTTLYSDGSDNVEGMSGGGFFMESGGITYLAGVLTKFSPDFKDFTCIKINKVNELLSANGYDHLLYSFANSLGLNRQWFDQQIQRSIKDLGDRYTLELNFELPIAQIFNGLTRDQAFQEQVKSYFHEFLKVIGKDDDLREPEELNMVAYFKEKHIWFCKFFEETSWETPGNLKLKELNDLLSEMQEEVHGFQQRIQELQYKEKENLTRENQRYFQSQFASEASRLRQIISAIYQFQNQLNSENFLLAQTPCLLLYGKAGYGKSHLLGDIASQKQKQGLPAILILGNKLRSDQNVWRQIMDELGLVCDADAFLKILNAIGQHFEERVLLMIDALNEGNGKSFWQNHLSGFISHVRAYPFIGLTLAVRETYLDLIVPNALQKSSNLVKVEHTGFGGSELNAIKYFCRNFNLEQPRFPVLSPEFSNPQLLLLLCRSLRDSKKTAFPEGLQGITTIYEGYLDAVNRKIADTLDCLEKLRLVQKGLRHIAETMAVEGFGTMELLAAEKAFAEFHPEYGSGIFRELIREGTLHEDREWKNESEGYVDVVRFNYERFGDFIAAQYLLAKHFDPNNPKTAFQDGGFFANYFEENYFYHRLGMMEALSILLPEKYNIELLEVLPYNVLENSQFGEYAVRAFINSLFWRRVESIDRKKIRENCAPWIEKYRLVDYFRSTILHFAPITEHPYNADFIHNYHISLSMAELDEFWSPFIHNALSSEESAINRLLAWIWSDFDLSSLNQELRRLTGTLLAWILASSNNLLRDSATLGLVRLFMGYPEAMATLLEQFKNVNDLYVKERLFAVSLGVVTNSGKHPNIAQLTQCVYDQIFKEGIPPSHILLRDYARSIVEYALYLQLPIQVDVDRIRPPYGSSLPSNYPSEEEIKPFKTDFNSKEFKRTEAINRAQMAIEHDLLNWDFGRKVIRSKLKTFNGVVLPFSKEYQAFKQDLPNGTKNLFKNLEQIIQRPLTYQIWKSKEKSTEFWKIKEDFIKNSAYQIENKLRPEKQEIFKNKILPHLEALNQIKNPENRLSIDPDSIARWIFKKVFELGWHKDWHGEFDHKVHDRDYGIDQGTDRIGKKYQWIAWYEILAMISDNHMVLNFDRKHEPYQGTWEPFVRNIDPTYPFLERGSIFSPPAQAQTWWLPPIYNKWKIEEWLDKTEDLPDPRKMLDVKDPNNEQWLNLLSFPEWKNKDEFGIHEDDSTSQIIWYHLRAYLVQQKNADKLFHWLSQQHFMGLWMPEEKGIYEVFEKEYFWSPAYLYSNTEEMRKSFKRGKYWQHFGDSTYKGIVLTEEYNIGGGSYTNQGGNIIKPSHYLWDQMKLCHGKKTGEYANNDEVVCVTPHFENNNSRSFFIRKNFLMDFLEKEKLSLCWTLLGEKQIHHRPAPAREFSIAEFSGAYLLLPDGNIDGGLRIVKEPSRE